MTSRRIEHVPWQAAHHIVVARLDRAIQYARARLIDRETLQYWATRCCGW
jgi:hypothetical protein